MIRKLKSISRSLGAIAVLVATTGCPTDNAKNPGQSLQTPTAPFAGIQVTMGSSRSMLEVGDDETVAVISVEVLRTADWTPVPNGTDAVFAATLGAIDSPSGGRAVTIDLINGRGSITLYPGDTDGTARVSVNVGGAIAVLNITIKPDPTGGVPPEPAPVQSTLDFVVSPSFLSEQDATDDGAGPSTVTLTAKVLGSDGDPFKGAGIYFTTPIGVFSNGSATSATFKTNSAGLVTETLTIPDAELLGFPGSNFTLVAHLGIEGGERTDNATVTIVAGPAPLEATSVILQLLPDATVDDDGGADSVTLRAIVSDQNGGKFGGATVFFTTQLGTLTAPSAVSAGGTGIAEVTLDLTAGQISGFGPNSFTVGADILVDSDVGVVTIARPPAPALNASFTTSTTTPCHDNLEGVSTVQFTDTSTGAILTWAWDLDGDGATDDANVPSPLFDYDGFTAGVARQVTLIISDGSSSDSAQVLITPTDCI